MSNRPQRRTMSQQRNDLLGGTADSTTSASIAQNITSFGIWVAVRVRPFSHRELAEGLPSAEAEGVHAAPQPVVEVERDGKTMTLLDPTRGFAERSNFHFDYCFSAFRPSIVLDSDQPASPASVAEESDGEDDDGSLQRERSQSEIYSALGQPIVNAAWQGYNSCIFAYGQTSSGKTYTMMGSKSNPGVIPRLARQLFETIEEDNIRRAQAEGDIPVEGGASAGAVATGGTGTRKITKVTVTYMEIYNEMVRDLLRPKAKDKRPQFKNRWDNNAVEDEYQNLRVRQHPLHGPFVDGITKCDADNWTDCVRLIRQGSDLRSSCSTDMNDSSSRSHAIFQLIVTQTELFGAKVRGKEVTNHKISKINLVDLAGSERITRTNVTGKHVTEANYINKSLSTLRKVIDVLVSKKKAGSAVVVPYRESLLTWILADNFGGNSKTAMIANISPHHSNFLETESTLRYATLAKGIINRVRVNEDASAKLIRELKSQLEQLKQELAIGPQGDRVRELEDQMVENQRAMEELLTREAGMRILIHESRKREEQLFNENEDLRRNQQHWKEEAERLAKQKEQLTLTLRQLAADGKLNDSLLSSNRENFWMVEDGRDGVNAKAKDDDDSCPPHQEALLKRRRSSYRQKPTPQSSGTVASEIPQTLEEVLALESPVKHNANKPASGHPSAEFQELITNKEPRKEEDHRPHAESPSVTAARYGRRAVTEEGQRTNKNSDDIGSNFSNTNDHSMVRTAENPRGSRRRDPDAPTTASVPVSLSHLVGPSTSTHASSDSSVPVLSPGVPQKQHSMSPDALDSFLSGSPEGSGHGKAGKALPPWKQPRKAKKVVEAELVE